MDLGPVAEIMRSYPWTCIECKTCEICHEKGDDVRVILRFLNFNTHID